jgi:hypothetical protein
MTLQLVLKSQYHAALAMLKGAIEGCPDALWDGDDHPNRFWQVAYHTLFYAHLYLQPDEASFRPWEGHHQEWLSLGDQLPPDPSSAPIGRPSTREEVLSYWGFCDRMVDAAIDRLDLAAVESGFWWYRMSKLEHQLVNIRHIQHHAGQLSARVRLATGTGVSWVGARSPGTDGAA